MVFFLFTFSALTLFMARVGTNYAHYTLTANNAAVLANATNRTTYFHGLTLFVSGRTKVYFIKKLPI
jgi:hypothetical protein